MSITLTNQSCFDFLKTTPDKSIDLVLIDPPYEVSRDTNFQSGEPKGDNTDRFRVSMDFGEWDSNFTGLDLVIKECYRILKDGGTLICFYDLWKLTALKDYFELANFKQLRFIEWLKTNTAARKLFADARRFQFATVQWYSVLYSVRHSGQTQCRLSRVTYPL